MAATHVQSPAFTEGDEISLAATFATQPIVGNYVIVAAAAWTGGPAADVTGVVDNYSNTYNVAVTTDSSGNANAEIWYAKVDTTGAAFEVTVTWNKSSGGCIGISEWSGLAATSPLDGTQATSDVSASASVGPITPTGNALYVGVLAVAGDVTVTPDGAWNERHNNSPGSAVVNMSHETKVTSGAQSAAWTLSASDDWAAAVAGFKAPAARYILGTH